MLGLYGVVLVPLRFKNKLYIMMLCMSSGSVLLAWAPLHKVTFKDLSVRQGSSLGIKLKCVHKYPDFI